MNYMRLFGYAAQSAGPLPLPSACVTTTVINYPPNTSINNSTLTYVGPLTDGFFSPIELATTTYTTVITTQGPDGTTELQTHTILGAPVDLYRSSSPSPILTDVIVSSSSSDLVVTNSATITQLVSTGSALPQSSTKPQRDRPVPRPGSGQPGTGPPFGYPPSDSGDGVDDDFWNAPPYPGPSRPPIPPFGINRPPSDAGDGVYDDSFEEDRPKYPSEHHTKQHPKQPNPHPGQVNGQKPEASGYPTKPIPLPDNDPYDSYTSLAYPVNPGYPINHI
ncbi:hypothetical protein E8E13_000316 [Curvularia kusanoi]|uniref:Uncharacterized protein n=1 Tax=Curvularia kusanoi TaxID=90978 RepID=A0A9P4T3R4_CURKU|nr:hypothetical protein E8E13_000316 [Curvularia kusanoi]